MERKKVDVIIPTYHPGPEFGEILERLTRQTYPVHRIIVMNTEQKFWNPEWEKKFSALEVYHLQKSAFDHGGTRKAAAAISDGEIMVFMTQDALPADRRLVEKLTAPILADEAVAAAYARQLPRKDCGFAERYARSFNYPDTSFVRSEKDLPVYGIKTYFCSNVCAAYRKKVYEQLGGFVERTIFNEDMIFAGKLVKNKYSIAYAADARVIHSHNYSGMQQFHRNFDLGVSQADHPEVFADVPSEGEGIRFIRQTVRYLCASGRFWLIPQLVFQSCCKYAGYLAGKHYARLPRRVILLCTMNRDYWTGSGKFC